MKKSTIPLVSLVILVSAICLASTLAQKPKDKAAQTKQQSAAGNPDYACPIWPIMAVDGGILYYCDNFPTDDCEETPEAAYLVGEYQWPAICDSQCEHVVYTREQLQAVEKQMASGSRKTKSLTLRSHFPGHSATLDPDAFELAIPAGKGRQFSSLAGEPWYLHFTFEEQEVHAKVFDYVVNVGQVDDPSGRPRYRTIAVAYEVSSPSTSVFEISSDRIQRVGGDASLIFRIELDNRNSILVVGAKPRER